MKSIFKIFYLLFLFPVMVSSQIYKEMAFDMGIDHYSYDPNAMGGGVVVFDFNGDGFEDLFFTGGLNEDRLYENIGGEYFKDVSSEMGITTALFGAKTMGAVTGDIDNDGYLDLLVTTAENERCYLLKNNNGTFFQDISISAGITHKNWSSTATMGDYDLDGDLDVYVGNYVSYSALPFEQNIIAPQKDFFYQNNGNGKFTLINDLLTNEEVGCTLVASFSDIDQDGDSDLFLLNDFGDFYQGNKLLLNNYPQNTYQEIASSVGIDIQINSMGIACGDYDEDGDFDYYITNIGENFLFEKQDGFDFDNVSHIKNVNDGTGFSWGTAFIDIDNDSYLDLFVAKGTILPQNNPQGNKLFQYDRTTGNFLDRSIAEGMAEENRARGMAYGDFNNDGKIDFSVANIKVDQANDGKALLYINEGDFENNWVRIILEGTTSNKSAYGSNVVVSANGRSFVKELTGGSSYLSSHSNVVHFGLGDIETIDELVISWPGNRKEVFTNLKVNRTYKIIEEGRIHLQTSNYVELCRGETIFLEGAERNEAGIYTDVSQVSGGMDEIVITRLVINESDDCGDTVDEPDNPDTSKYSVARKWNELLLESIRKDYARPTVHARNLFHTSIAMYDAWAVYNRNAQTFFLGNTIGDFTSVFDAVPSPQNITLAQEEAMSYACFRLLSHRFENSPGFAELHQDYNDLMVALGYDVSYEAMDYQNGSPAALGNYLAQQIILFGHQDGSNEINDYRNNFYTPSNMPLVVDESGNPNLTYPNKWQPLTLSIFIDQSGNVIGDDTPGFLSPEWGQVVPFALNKEDASINSKDGFDYWIYDDPGSPVEITAEKPGLEDPYKWGFAMVAVWSSHLDAKDEIMVDISPSAMGNIDISDFPKTFQEYKAFYNFMEGGDIGKGHPINPITQSPYTPQIVPRGDFARILAEFWADGPDSETPPGHWFSILNYVSDHPLTIKKISGEGEILGNLEWDVKSYLALGGAMHDAAISAWGIKGYYDYIRPISAIRHMADKGQSTNEALDNYDPNGLPLISGYIEIVEEGDLLAGENGEHVGEIKIFAWQGTHFIDNPNVDVAGVDWILAKDWVPYQRPSFVTPPFAGYVSGHSTFSRAAAEVLTLLTGSEFFPGGMGTFDTKKNEFLVFEDGPSTDITLQWATYQDASDQCSLSRIWGGIHPPIDDIPGRLIGHKIGVSAFERAKIYFTGSQDGTNVNFNAKVYPNPVGYDQILKIIPNNTIEGKLQLQLIDLGGKIVCERETEMNKEKRMDFNLCAPSDGLYILVVKKNGNLLFSKKIIIARVMH
ncbi:FG-GAP-like repeat-containing protein [Maribacter sp. 2304DJ31-5]|uniref:FG-GAP-like repeat-containing protein n=1 Tax=Maribacter sp. 2304DJ31-5 TaxID=3386273 RepID=UPI0039BC822B